jgi:hypothetical protein
MINYPCGWYDTKQLPPKKKNIETKVPNYPLPKSGLRIKK